MAYYDKIDGAAVAVSAHEGGRKVAVVREQDRLLPIANVSRIMKKALPQNAKVAKDARETMQECVSEFISFITSEASDKCLQEKRKTINGEDILWAMSTLGFDKYVEPLKVYLQKYKESVKGDKPSKRSKKDQQQNYATGGDVELQNALMVQHAVAEAAAYASMPQGIRQPDMSNLTR